jgi:hypothetical protein
MTMTVDELRACLARFAGSDVVVLDTLPRCKRLTINRRRLAPARDSVDKTRVTANGDSYHCAVLTVSDWP